MATPEQHHQEPLERSIPERQIEWREAAPVRRRIAAGYRRYSDAAFTAFLSLPETELHDPRLLGVFERRWLGTLPDLDAIRDAYLHSLGWATAAAFLRPPGDGEDTLQIDTKRLDDELYKRFVIVSYDGELHVFSAQPSAP